MRNFPDAGSTSEKGNSESKWLCLAVIAPSIENMALLFSPLDSTSIAWLDALIMLLVWGYIILKSVKVGLVITNQLARTLAMLFGFVLLWNISKGITPGIVEVVDHPTVSFFLKSAPMFYFGLTMRSYKSILYGLRPYVWFCFLYGIIAFSMNSSAAYGGIAMSVAYDILGGGMLAFALYICDKKKRYLAVAMMIMVLLLLLGSRGALIIMIIFTAVAMFLSARKNSSRFAVFALVSFLFAALVLLFLEPILSFLVRIFPDSRVINLLISGNIFKGSGRSELTEYCIKVISQAPLKIRGLFADRSVLINYFGGTSLMGFWIEPDAGSALYAHNIFLELIMQFGIILGGGLCVYILLQNAKVLRLSIGTDCIYTSLLSLFIFCRGMLQLLVSSSYVLNSWFWLFIGFALSLKVGRRK